MSKAQRRAGKYSPDDCAVIRTNLIKVFVVVGDLLHRPVELNDGGKKPLAFVCWSKGFSFLVRLLCFGFRLASTICRKNQIG